MSAPVDYTNLSILVNPQLISACAVAIIGPDSKNLGGWVNEILESLKKIEDAVQGLKLSWQGSTADEAQAFITQWQAAIQLMVGAKDDPQDGALTRLAMALSVAANNYNTVEQAIMNMMAQYIEAFAPLYQVPGGSQSSYLPAPSGDISYPWQGPVSEIF